MDELERIKEKALELINGGMRTCTICHLLKPLDDFYSDKRYNKNYRKGECKSCHASKQLKGYEMNKKCRINKLINATDEERLKVGDVIYTPADLTLHNYKEPLLPVKEGYGYYGTISQTKDGEFVQCHICGKLFRNLNGHIHSLHKMEVREYKEQFGLAYTNALVADNERDRAKQHTLEWLKTLTEEQKEEWKQRARERALKKHKIKRPQPKETLEAKNKKGTCPDQLLAKIVEVKEKIGHTPSKDEFNRTLGTQRFTHLIYKLFGSWSSALYMAGFEPKESKGGNKKGWIEYDDEQLLEYLRMFVAENKRVPTTTDFNREYLPSLDVYARHFGNLGNARKEAGVYEILGIEPVKGSFEIA